MRSMSLSLDDINRKSIVNKVARERLHTVSLDHSTVVTGNSHSIARENYIMITESELLTAALGDSKSIAAIEKRCREYDIYNEAIYKRNCKVYQSVLQKLQNTSMEIKQPPNPAPSPNNQERLTMCRIRNRQVNCLEQTNAVQYLLSHGWVLIQQPSALDMIIERPSQPAEFRQEFEAYQAIDLATTLSHKLGEDFMHRPAAIPTTPQQPSHYQSSQAQPSCPPYNPIYPHEQLQLEPDYLYQHTHSHTQTHGQLTCQKPEHHEIKDKINYFNSQTE